MTAPTLTEARAALAAALAASGYDTAAYVPDQIEPPLVIVQPSSDYLQAEDTTFDPDEYLANLDVFLLADYRSSEQAADTLDAMLSAVLPQVAAAGWNLTGMGAPGPYNTADWIAHGVRMTVTRNIQIQPAGLA